MPIYELALWDQGSEAVRITDKPVSVGQTLLIDDIKWLVEAQELPRDPKATERSVCSRHAATASNRPAPERERVAVPPKRDSGASTQSDRIALAVRVLYTRASPYDTMTGQ
jgi:hypothetical protein